MPSFDIVSKVDSGELKNAVLQAQKEIATRFDFKGSKTSIELTSEHIEIKGENEVRVKGALDVLRTKMAKRNVGMRTFDAGEIEASGSQMWKQILKLKQGIDKDQGRIINRLVKESGFKITSSYLDEKIRVQGKKIDELQAFWSYIRGHKEVLVDLQMENMKRE